MALCIDLLSEFRRAFEADDLSRVRRFIDYAKWCWDARDGDTVNAAACGFLERARIPEWFSRTEFDRLRPVFTYHAGEAVVADIER